MEKGPTTLRIGVGGNYTADDKPSTKMVTAHNFKNNTDKLSRDKTEN